MYVDVRLNRRPRTFDDPCREASSNFYLSWNVFPLESAFQLQALSEYLATYYPPGFFAPGTHIMVTTPFPQASVCSPGTRSSAEPFASCVYSG